MKIKAGLGESNGIGAIVSKKGSRQAGKEARKSIQKEKMRGEDTVHEKRQE